MTTITEITEALILLFQVLDISFDYSGTKLATASSDGTAKLWSVGGAVELLQTFRGHNDEVSKVGIEAGWVV